VIEIFIFCWALLLFSLFKLLSVMEISSHWKCVLKIKLFPVKLKISKLLLVRVTSD